jgi:tetratricopeptide (TPR) repeat protein
LAIYHGNIGDVFTAQGRLKEALKAYRDNVAIFEHLAAADRSNRQWQYDLAVFHNKVGNVLLQQNNSVEALQAYRDSLAIMEPLVRSDPSNVGWLRELVFSYKKVGGIAFIKLHSDSGQTDLQFFVETIGNLAYRLVLVRDYSEALEAADHAISIAPDWLWLHVNRAHALMFLGRVEEARTLYVRHRGEKNIPDGRLWETVIREDFAELRKAGLTHPLMDEIEKRFAAAG